MHAFFRSLVKTASELVQDEENIRDIVEKIHNAESNFWNGYEALLKGHWVFHTQRLWLISRRESLQNRDVNGLKPISVESFKICFRKFRILNGDLYSCYAPLIPLLRKDPVLLANLLFMYNSAPFLFERLSASVFCSLANFSLEYPSSVFLYSVLQHLLLVSSKNGGTGSHFLKELRTSFPMRFFLEGLPDSRRYLSALLYDVVTEISVRDCPLEENCDERNKSQHPKSRSVFYCASPCKSHCPSDLPSFVNSLINNFQNTIPLFPRSCLLWLHSLRETVHTAGASESVLHKTTVDHILSFVTRAILNPELFLVSGPYLDPAGHGFLKVIAAAFNFLAHVDHNASPTDNALMQFSSETGIQAAKLLEACDARKLQSSIDAIINNADRVSPTDCSIQAEEKANFSELHNATSATSVHPADSIFMITPTDFNILVDCLRIFMQKTSDGFDEVRNVLSQLPARVPGSLIGVQLREVPASNATTTSNRPYQMVYYEPNPPNETPPKKSNTNFRINRSRSASRLGVVRAARLAQPDSNSLGRSKSPIGSELRPLHSFDSPTGTGAQQTVLILQLTNGHASCQPSILTESEFRASRPRHPSATDPAAQPQPPHTDSTKLPLLDVSFNQSTAGGNSDVRTFLATTAGHEQPISQSSSQSSRGSSGSCGDHAGRNAAHGDADVDEDDVDGGDSSPMRLLHCTRLRCHGQAPSMDEQCSQNGLLLDGSTEDLMMAEDRSINDPSSDASERSGFTSLASSAHAMRVRLGSGLRALAQQSRQGSSDCMAPVATGSHAPAPSSSSPRGMTVHACHGLGTAQPYGLEKRTRFSQAVLCDQRAIVTGLDSVTGPSESNAPRQLRDRHATRGSLEADDAVAMSSNQSVDCTTHSFARARTVPRTASVELVHRCGPDAMGVGGAILAPADRRTDRVGHSGSILCSPTAVRCSSLNCLPVPRSTSLTVSGVPRATTGPGSLQTPATFEYVHEAEERSSGITCSSCGVRFSETTDDAEQRGLGREGSHGDTDSQAHLEDSHLGTRLGDQEQEADEDALSDLPDLSSANVSGRVTPLSLTSSTSRGGGGGGAPSSTGPLLGDSPGTRVRAYNRAGIVVPNGVTLPPSTAVAVAAASSSASGAVVGHGHPGSVRFGVLDFPASLLHSHGPPDVTDKFGKFDLPVTRLPEAEARSTVSDTWSTDVLPSDTEYPDGGSEYLGPEPSGGTAAQGRQLSSDRDRTRLSEHSHGHQQYHHHHHHHHHHHRRGPRSATRSTRQVETNNPDPGDLVSMMGQQPHDSPTDHSPDDDRSAPHRSAFCTPMGDADTLASRLELHPPLENSTLPAALETTQSNQTPVGSSVGDFRGTTTTMELAIDMLESGTYRSSSPTLTPLAAHCDAGDQPTVPAPNQLGATNRMPRTVTVLIEGYSRLKDKIDFVGRRSQGTATVDRTGETGQATTDNGSVMMPSAANVPRNAPADPDRSTGSDPRSHIRATISSALDTRSNTDLPHPSSRHPPGIQPITSTADRADETVDEMMDRYRRQSSAKSPQLTFRHVHDRSDQGEPRPSTIPSSTGTTNSGGGTNAVTVRAVANSVPATRAAACSSSWTSRTALPSGSAQLRVQVVRGLRRLFSNPLVESMLEAIGCQLMTTGFIPTGAEHLRDWPRQDVFFLTLLDALVEDTLISQDTSLTTCIRETKRLLERLLLNAHLVSRDQGPTSRTQPITVSPWTDNVASRNNSQTQSSAMQCDSVVAGLLRQLRTERLHRLAYLAYLTEQRDRVAARKRWLALRRRRCERDLQVQCEYIVHKSVSTYLDSQLETFQAFYTRFAEQRQQSETDDRGAVASGRGGGSVASRLASQLIDDLVQRWEAIEPARRPPILLPVARLGPGQEDVDADFAHLASSHLLFARLHIQRLVMEKVYRSGIWMNDASLDREKDRVLHRELASLSRVITLSELQVPERFHAFAPFHSVQEELRRLDCSHLPSDMILCLKRVMERIVATLQLACPDSAPSADDLLPVLIFVILQVNPPRLLTNVAFLDLFLDHLDGEDQYVWCQFCSAVSEIRRLLSVVQLDSD